MQGRGIVQGHLAGMVVSHVSVLPVCVAPGLPGPLPGEGGLQLC